ncbi:hypothetical protein B0T16DRAFT_456412 [Cercophora newfieldiana]|uniref:Uncharacterized protein n=1 Tax=Cercophora newfieldiana TaxID=92897 RepID=A0AA39YDE6_9PEZI|nr:hypothetical protein B0T16DRAFT_456412 [Cercophora newfieldiana]
MNTTKASAVDKMSDNKYAILEALRGITSAVTTPTPALQAALADWLVLASAGASPPILFHFLEERADWTSTLSLRGADLGQAINVISLGRTMNFTVLFVVLQSVKGVDEDPFTLVKIADERGYTMKESGAEIPKADLVKSMLESFDVDGAFGWEDEGKALTGMVNSDESDSSENFVEMWVRKTALVIIHNDILGHGEGLGDWDLLSLRKEWERSMDQTDGGIPHIRSLRKVIHRTVRDLLFRRYHFDMVGQIAAKCCLSPQTRVDAEFVRSKDFQRAIMPMILKINTAMTRATVEAMTKISRAANRQQQSDAGLRFFGGLSQQDGDHSRLVEFLLCHSEPARRDPDHLGFFASQPQL